MELTAAWHTQCSLCAEVDGRLEAVIADFGLSTLLPRLNLSKHSMEL